MATALEETFGLTTDDALLACRRNRLDLLSNGNRWKPFLLDHVAGVHMGRPERFAGICLICSRDRVNTAAPSGAQP